MAKCPVCDHRIDEGVEFCPSCGSRLGWKQPAVEDVEPEGSGPTTDQQTGSGRVSLLTDPSLLEVAPGGTAAVQLTINNQSDSEDTFQIDLSQNLPLRVSVEPSPSVRIQANRSAVVILTIELPAHLDIGESAYLTVKVSSTADPQKSADQSVQIRPVTTGAVLSARQVRRSGLRSATFEARLTNNGNTPVEWTAMGSAPDDIDVAVAPTPLVVPPGESALVTVAATAEGLNWGSPRDHHITVGGPADVIRNRLDLIFSQSSAVWPAVVGVVLVVVALILLIGALDTGPAPGTTLAAGTSTTSSTTVVSTTGATTPTTTGTTVTDANAGTPEGDLGIPGYDMVVPTCDDQYITVLYSAIEPGAYEEQVASNLDAYPNSNYLRTDQSCPSLRQEIEGNPIYAVFYGPFETAGEACDALADENSYVRLLSETTPPGEATVDCE